MSRRTWTCTLGCSAEHVLLACMSTWKRKAGTPPLDPQAMPWVHDVHGIVQAWYAGNETGNSLADVLFGALNPSGRLPITLPVRVQDIPAFPNFRSEHGQIHYREDLFVGYKWYQARGIAPLFPFGCAFLHPAQFIAHKQSI